MRRQMRVAARLTGVGAMALAAAALTAGLGSAGQARGGERDGREPSENHERD